MSSLFLCCEDNLLCAPENPFRPDGVSFRLPIQSLQSAFQALFYFKRQGSLSFRYISVQIHAASAEAAGKMTSSFSSWLLMLYPYFLPE